MSGLNDHNTTQVGGGNSSDPNSEITSSARDGPAHDPVNEHGTSAAVGSSTGNSGSGYGQGSTGGGDFLDDPALAGSYDDDDYYGEPGYGTGRPDTGGPMGGMDTRSGFDRRGRPKMGLAGGVGGRSHDGTERRVETEPGYGTGTPDEGGPYGGMDTASGVNRRGEIITGLGPGPGGRITRPHKPTMMEKLRGTTEQVAGKMTGNPELVNRGDERKRGEL
ncbi:hypothetical protein PENSPDRAFT_649128 [Peniophora sp. CONT]|nr:hypothetical protein PENSPDRAFT_649128 [Peniophora sp. CONT]